MRLLLVGAFSYPHTLGSPVYFREQARALRDAGAEIHLLTYGPPRGREAEDGRSRGSDPASAPDLDPDGFEQTVVPAWARPASRRSGPSFGKPLADLALGLALRRLVGGSVAGANANADAKAGALVRSTRAASSSASKSASSVLAEPLRRASSIGCSRSLPTFDAVLAHHAEATLAALHLLSQPRPPIVYCAHTLLEEELPEYLKPSSPERFFDSTVAESGPSDESMTRAGMRHVLSRAGRVIDRRLARRTDAWIALTQSSARVIGAASEGPGRWIAPPLGDLRSEGRGAAGSERAGRAERPDSDGVTRAFGLVPDRFFLYAGNLDPYQDLPLLARVAQARRSSAFPVVIATHDERAGSASGPGHREARSEPSGLRRVRVRSAGEANALVAAARATIVPRRSVGGFPIKLLNSLALGRPVVAFHGDEWGLVDGANAIVCDPARPESSLLAALAALEADAALVRRLAEGARSTWVARHQPQRVAADTLDLIAQLG